MTLYCSGRVCRVHTAPDLRSSVPNYHHIQEAGTEGEVLGVLQTSYQLVLHSLS